MSGTRREFLKTTLCGTALVSLGGTAPAFLRQAAFAAESKREAGATVLVVLQLSGGNDGLNTVVPYTDEVYARSRPTLRLTGAEVHKIDDQLGFHPAMPGFRRLLDDGVLTVVQGVGYPNPNRDHDGGMRNWHTAQPGAPNPQTGWLGRAADIVCPPESSGVPAAFVGAIQRPFSLNAERTIVPVIRTIDQFRLQEAPGASGTPQWSAPAASPEGGAGNPLADFVRRSDASARVFSERVQAAMKQSKTDAEYPAVPLGRDLQTAAQLIRAELGIRIFHAELGGGGIGGFDSHANQKDNHGALLRQLSESLAAFVTDLKRAGLLDRVLLMTFSEFGRTVAENGRHGTGHGSAAPMFLAGGKLKGGLAGPHPRVDDPDGANGLKHHTDFRRVYATALESWLRLDRRAVLGADYKPLDVLRT